VAADSQKWVAGFGRLVKFDGSASTPFLFLDNDSKPFRLYRLVDDGDNLWVGTQLGLVLFSKIHDGGQIQDSYGLFGNLNPFPSVLDIYLSGDSIWLATSAGLAVAEKSNLDLLKSPANWTVFGRASYPVLTNDTVRRVISFNSQLYIGTPEGLFALNRSAGDTSFTRIPFDSGTSITDVEIENDSLFVYAGSGTYVSTGGAFSSLTISGLPSSPNTGILYGSSRWFGLSGGGIYYATGATYSAYPYSGMPDNFVTDVTVNRDGLITALYFRKAAAQLIDSVWVPRTYSVGDHNLVAISDSSGNAFAGTWGNALWRISPQGVLTKFDESNSTIRGVPGAGYYAVVRGLATDGQYLFAGVYRARTGCPIAIGYLPNLDQASAWDSLGVPDGITDTFIVSIDYHGGYLAAATEANGLYYCYVGDPFNKSDDTIRYLNADNSFLRSDAVRSVRFSPTGELWAGTNFGLSRFDPGLGANGRFVDVDLPAGIGPDISDLAFDPRGNLWVGTHSGLARRDAVTGQFTEYTPLNSGLVSSDINAVTFDSYTGDLYVSTSSGLSRLRSTIGHPTASVADAIAFPNPFIIGTSDAILGFNFSGAFTYRIFSLAGELVRESDLNTWDGRNQAGILVASGVYIFVLTDGSGNIGRGKILVIRK
ncbi:MAG TPA: two-component regulator propeller domain-containing protein, partial [Candidatus Acidoferrum sp.]|nr:two-component regulator propeller domain-containing protein [Candidatus Acidoferrum sp.]